MNKKLHLHRANLYAFLRRYARHIRESELRPIPHMGTNFVFYYGADSILKVAKKPGGRTALLKEARLLQHLETVELPVVLPRTVEVHDDGFYSVLSRLEGGPITAESLTTATETERAGICHRLGVFLSVLHSHEFPARLSALFPVSLESLETIRRRVVRRVALLKEHGRATSRWEDRITGLPTSLDETVTLTHGDFSFEHIFKGVNGIARPAVIDFNCAQYFDHCVDFSELLFGLHGMGTLLEETQEMILESYSVPDPHLRPKISLRLLDEEIRPIHRALVDTLA